MSEPKYIDANELRAMMYHGAFEEDSGMQRWDGGCWIRYKMFENALEQIGAADVVPERRGRWERKGYHLHCSCCDWSTDLATPYCPGCGAYLGGDAK